MSVRRQLLGSAAIDAALAGGKPLRRVVVRRGHEASLAELLRRARLAGVPVQHASPQHFDRLRQPGESPGILALVGPPPDASRDAVLAGDGATWQLLGVAFAGNVGGAVRTAEVSGADGIFVEPTGDRARRRAMLRAAMRADRFMPVLFEPAAPLLDAAEASGRKLVAIEAVGNVAPWDVDLTGRVHFIVGGEVDGVPPAVQGRCAEIVRIPMEGFVPSYNLQVAVAAVASERLRQRAGMPS